MWHTYSPFLWAFATYIVNQLEGRWNKFNLLKRKFLSPIIVKCLVIRRLKYIKVNNSYGLWVSFVDLILPCISWFHWIMWGCYMPAKEKTFYKLEWELSYLLTLRIVFTIWSVLGLWMYTMPYLRGTAKSRLFQRILVFQT